MEAQGGVVVREVPQGERGPVIPFVLSCWLESYKPRGMAAHGLSRDKQHAHQAYYKAHHPEFTGLLRASTLAIAHVEGEPDVYLGWAVGKPGLLHYVFVKGIARKHGIASRLVQAVAGDAERVIYTFEPSKGDGRPNAKLLAVAEKRGWRFHPHPVPGMEVRKQREEQRA
jgi:GNAT superfamily N-acetyltransferase